MFTHLLVPLDGSDLAETVLPYVHVPAHGKGPHAPALTRLLLPLDGTADAEVALPLAARIATATGGTLTLLLVVPTTGTLSGAMSTIARFSPTVTDELLSSAGKDATE